MPTSDLISTNNVFVNNEMDQKRCKEKKSKQNPSLQTTVQSHNTLQLLITVITNGIRYTLLAFFSPASTVQYKEQN